MEETVVGSGKKLRDSVKPIALISASGTANSGQRGHVKHTCLAVRNWHAHAVSVSARLNVVREYEKAERFVKRELKFFKSYVKGLRFGARLVSELELLTAKIGKELNPWVLKEMALEPRILMEARIDHRGSDKDS